MVNCFRLCYNSKSKIFFHRGDVLKKDAKRIYLLDELRGFAIVCMVIHHMFYDFGFVLGYNWGYKIFDFLCYFQPVFWAIFIVISGICSRLSRNTVKRGFIVFGAGLAVTFVTAVIMPLMNIYGAEIYFGVLSCLGLSMIITGFIMPIIEKTNVKLGLAVSFALFFITYSVNSGSLLFGLIKLPGFLYKSNWLCPLGFFNDSFASADYFSLLPWFFMFLFGAFLGKYAKDGAFPAWCYKRRVKFFEKVGKNSLWIYLFHQPVLYGIMYLISFFELVFILR